MLNLRIFFGDAMQLHLQIFWSVIFSELCLCLAQLHLVSTSVCHFFDALHIICYWMKCSYTRTVKSQVDGSMQKYCCNSQT